jgi:hypothetical protein
VPPAVKTIAKGWRRKPGDQNKTEAAYQLEIERREAAGEIDWYRWEGVRLKLADNTTYLPDFAVMLTDGTLEMHEVKGYWLSAARVKIKVAAEQYPFRFLAVTVIPKRDGGGWAYEEF